jgi:hypothetical protein
MLTSVLSVTAAGAVYIPLEEIVPTELLPPVTPFTCHTTPWFALLAT